MGCFGSGDEEKDRLDNQEASGNPTEQHIDRVCRDVLFGILFVAFWIGMLAVGGIGFSKGDPTRLVKGVDEYGARCGMGVNEGFPYLYFPYQNSISRRECVSKCWTKERIEEFDNDSGLGLMCVRRRGSPIEGADNEYAGVEGGKKWLAQNMEGPSGAMLCPIINPGVEPDDHNLVSDYVPYETSAVLGFCLPSAFTSFNSTALLEGEEDDSAVVSLAKSGGVAIANAMADLKTASGIIVAMAFVALFLGFIWLFLINTFAKAFVWGTVFTVIFVSYGFSGYVYYQGTEKQKWVDSADNPADSEVRKAQAILYLGYIGLGVSTVLLLILIFLRKRIQITAEIVREASKAVGRMPSLIFFPFVTFLLLSLLLVYWVTAALFLASAADETITDLTIEHDGENYEVQRLDMSYSDSLRYMILYHFFGLLWTVAFLLAMTEMVIAGAVANWYWAPSDTMGKKKLASDWPVWDSFKMVFRYYLGTVAFGSLLVAIVQFMRAVVEYIDHLSKKYPENKAVKFTICFCRCCLWCFEKCLKFINRNAYIMVAVYGEGFCASAKSAFFLILDNVARMAAVNLIGDFLLFLGKIIVAGLTGFIGYVILNSFDEAELSSPLVPTVLIVLIAFGIGSGFMSVYEMAIDTVLLCFCKDCKENNGKAVYCSPALKDILGGDEAPRRESMSKEPPTEQSSRN